MRILAVVVFAAGCGSSTPSPTPAPAPGAPAAEPDATATAPAPAATGWAALDRDARLKVMKEQVLPRMEKAFGEFDAKRFKKVTCLTCHGDGALDGGYEMPNPELPALDFGAGWEEYAAEHAEILAFMKDTVSPAMVEILGVEPYSEQNPDGFGCYACHPKP